MDSFDEFVAARGPALVRTAWLLTGSREDAEDLVQEALMKTCTRFARLAQDGSHAYEAYVRRALHNVFVSSMRQRRVKIAHVETPDLAQVERDEPLLRSVVIDSLRELSRRQREVVVLRFYEQLSIDETALLLGCSTGSVKTHQSRAIGQLRRTDFFKELQYEGGQR